MQKNVLDSLKHFYKRMRALRRSRLEDYMERKYMHAFLARKIKSLRLQHSLTQKQLGALLNKGESTVRMWELGESIPPLPAVIDLAIIFQVSIDELIGLEEIK